MGNNSANFIWNIADHLRGTYKATEYGKIVIPFTILRRLDCVLEATKPAVLNAWNAHSEPSLADAFARSASGYQFYNKSDYTLTTLLSDSANLKDNLLDYIDGFSENIKDIFTRFRLQDEIQKLDENDLLYLTVQKFASEDFHPNTISNHDMGLLFEELIRKFAEDSAADNGEFFTPRDAIKLAVHLLFAVDEEYLKSADAPIRSIYDPTAGTGGMLSVASEWMEELNSDASLELFGQELNPESYAICKSDMVAKGQSVDNIKLGNTLSNDQHQDAEFDYVISNPPYGTKWEKEKEAVEKEYTELGFDGRFGPGLPASSDGQLLFLLHAVSKLPKKNADGTGGGRAAVILNGSSLFSGDAGSGASNIRRWLFEQDYVDAIVALPTNIFYSTGISTYIWLIDTNKSADKRGKVQLVEASQAFAKLRKSLGDKTRELTAANIEDILSVYKTSEASDVVESKTFDTNEFGYRVITTEQPLRSKYIWNAEARSKLDSVASFTKLSEARQTDIVEFLDKAFTDVLFDSFTDLDVTLVQKAKTAALKLTTVERKAIASTMQTNELGEGKASTNAKGEIIADPELRDTETVPLTEDVDSYLKREVLPYTPNAWVDESKTKIGYEVPFNRFFYKKASSRSLDEIENELREKVALISKLLVGGN